MERMIWNTTRFGRPRLYAEWEHHEYIIERTAPKSLWCVLIYDGDALCVLPDIFMAADAAEKHRAMIMDNVIWIDDWRGRLSPAPGAAGT